MEANRKTAILTGVFTLIAMILSVSLMAVILQWQKRSSGFEIRLKYTQLNNLQEGSPVRLSGGSVVGEVVSIYQENLQTYVKVYLDQSLRNKLPKRLSTQFAIFSTSLAGQKYVNLFIPEIVDGDEFLQDGDEWWGVNPPSFNQMLLAFSSWFEGRSSGEIMKNIGAHATGLITDFNSIVLENRKDVNQIMLDVEKSFQAFSSQFGSLAKNVKAISPSMGQRNLASQKYLQNLKDNVKRISLNIDSISRKLAKNKGSYKKFANNKEIYKNSLSIISNARIFVKCIQDTPIVLVSKRSCAK